MNDVISTPSPWLRVFSALARWAVWLLASAWVTLGLVWGGLHFVIVPRIGDLRPWLEQQATKSLGVTVRIGAVNAKSNGLIPSVELRDVRLQDAQGRDALVLPSVLAALSPRSALGLGFEQLYVDGPQLDVRRAKDGRFWIAGFELPDNQSAGTEGADWLFSQSELAIRHGKIRWTDETRPAPALDLDDVDIVLRNHLRSHALRIDANPPDGWGQRFTWMGQFKQPFLSTRKGNWREWAGQLYARTDVLDLARLRNYADLGFELSKGSGAVRAWVDIDRAKIVSATADVSLNEVTAKVSPKLEALDFVWMSGRLGFNLLDGGLEYLTHDLAFETRDGLRWPGGNVRLALFDAQGNALQRGSPPSAHGELNADRMDLAAMAEIANRLPLDSALHDKLLALRPKGLVDTLQLGWQGTLAAPQKFAAKGHVSGLQVAASAKGEGGVPGVRGADIDFDVNQSNGKASVAMKNGALELPEIFDEPTLAFDSLAAQVQWKWDARQVQVDVSKLQFANSDGQGEAQIKWQSAPPSAKQVQRASEPGFLDLQGTLSRLEGAALHRYLPTAMQKQGRDYLHAALLGGTASNVKFKVRGDLAKFPFYDSKQGEFRIGGVFQNAMFAFAPPFLLPKDSMLWPVLTQASGELLIEHDNLHVKGGKAMVAGSPGLQVTKGESTISKLYDAPVVAVNVEGKGPLLDALGVVNNSPVSVWTNKVLSRATASGNADYKLKLQVPVMNVERSTVQGSIVLAGNDVQISPDLPRLVRARGQIAFTESGFTVTGGQARALGGDMRIDGGLSVAGSSTNNPAPAALSGTTPGRPQVNVLRLLGTATAEGMRQARELGAVARLGQFASGSTSYSATIGLRSGTPELLITSPLTGMALTLPAPFSKAADTSIPLRFETALVRGSNLAGAKLQDQISIDVGRLANVVYVRDISGPDSRVLRGAIAVGLANDESAPIPAEGVVANVNMGQLDVDAWVGVLSTIGAATSTGAQPAAGIPASAMAYLPNTLAIRAKELLVEGRKINNVVVGGGRDGLVWRANVDANEINGYVEYRQPSGNSQGRLFARLAHLNLGPSAAQDMETLLDQQPASIPGLDVVVEDFVLRGKKLGRVDMQATNMFSGAARDGSREWRLNRLNVTMPEATLTATGNWTNVNAQASISLPRSARERRRTVLNFKLDIADSGDLLKRLDMPGVIAKGKGKIEGQVSWLGSPVTLDYPSMSGAMNVNVEAGQFLKADPGIAKLFGVLSLQSLPRRLTLDFRDVFSDGFAFDYVRGDVNIEQGIARTNNLQMRGVNAVVFMDGQADIEKETQNIDVVVIPEINAGSASLLASAVNPIIGLTTFLAQAILRGPLINANTQQFLIDGTWVDPRVTKVERK